MTNKILGGGFIDGRLGSNPDWSTVYVGTGRTIWSSYDDNTLQAWLVEDTNKGGFELAGGNYANPIQVAGNGLPRIAGYFVDGFDFENPNQVGIDASGNSWQYVGTSPLPYTVTAGTVPSAPNYELVFTNDHNNLTNRNAVGAHDADAISKFNSNKDKQSALIKTDETVTINVPADFSSWVAAVNFAAGSLATSNKVIVINLQSGYQIEKGLRITGGDYSCIKITSEDAVVSLSGAFVGADTTGIPAGILGEAPRPPLLCAYKAKCPEWDISVDMGNQFGTGHQLAESEITVNTGKGVVNAGFRGIQVHGRANIYGADYSGASGTSIRLQQASSCNARSAIADDSCKTEDLTNSAVYVSRSSNLEFRGGSATNSGASGLIARRSVVTADEAIFDGAATFGVFSESQGANISFSNGSALNTGSSSVAVGAGGSISCGSASLSRPSSPANTINLNGGSIWLNGGTTVNGLSGESAIRGASNAPYLNAVFTRGMIVYNNGAGAFDTGSYENGFYERKSNNVQQTYTGAFVINTGTVTPNSFSQQLTLPVPEPFTEIVSVTVTAVGRTSTGGGGSRVCVSVFHDLVGSGSNFKIKNEAMQLDGNNTTLNVESIQVYVDIIGTWR